MDQSRYRDRDYLVTYELTTDIFDAYGLKIDDIVPIRSVYILYSDKGVKIIKKINYGTDELQFIKNVIDHAGMKYPFIVPFMNTLEGKYYIEKDEGIYVILDIIEGREADFENTDDLCAISDALCNFHNATMDFNNIILNRNNLNRWIPEFNKRLKELLKFREISEMHYIKSSFDRLFLEYVDRFYEEALHSIELLEKSSYNRLCREGNVEKCICHHDLSYHNIIIDDKNHVYFADLDYCILDLRIHDIGNLIVKSIKHCGWDLNKARLIIENYSRNYEISRNELEILYDFLVFPQEFYEISMQYYMKTKNWDEEDFLSRLERKTSFYVERKRFLNEFGEFIKMRV